MKAYFVYTWSGEYEQYEEYDQKYFLHESTARKYELELEETKKLQDEESYKRDIEWRQKEGHLRATDKYYNDTIYGGSGVCFEEIEIIEEVTPTE